MAIAFDAASGGDGFIVNSFSWSHTCSGSDRILWVAVTADSESITPTATYNGVSMTLGVSQAVGSNKLWLFYLVAPATGANTVEVANFGLRTGTGHSASYTGASQTGVPDATATGGNVLLTSLTVSPTTVADNCWLVMGGFAMGQTISAGTGATLRDGRSSSTDPRGAILDSNAAKTPAGSHSIQFTVPSSTTLVGVVASFAPSAGEAGHPAMRRLGLVPGCRPVEIGRSGVRVF